MQLRGINEDSYKDVISVRICTTPEEPRRSNGSNYYTDSDTVWVNYRLALVMTQCRSGTCNNATVMTQYRSGICNNTTEMTQCRSGICNNATEMTQYRSGICNYTTIPMVDNKIVT